MPEERRSLITTAGAQRAPNRAMLRAVGFGDGDFGKPIVGVANALQHHHALQPRARRPGRRGPRPRCAAAGAMPQIFGTITVSDGISMGTEGMKYSLVSREVIADSIETVLQRRRAWTACSPSAAATRTCPGR